MSQFVNQTHRTMYADNVSLLLQQKTAKLLASVTSKDVSGEIYKITDQIGHVKANQITSRHADTKYVDTPHDGRWLAQPNANVYADLCDKHDKLASGIELSGMYAMTARATLNRAVDDAIIGGIFGTAQTGLKGTVLTPASASNVVGVSVGAATSNLNVAKLAAANEVLRANYVDMEEDECWMPITASQNRALLGELEATSRDYAATGAEIKNGIIHMLHGFRFIHIELGNPMFDNAALTLDGSGYRKVPFYAKSGMFCGFWERLFANISELPTKNFSAQVYARNQVAATRTEEDKVGWILCNEA